jgi:hypothetical protein
MPITQRVHRLIELLRDIEAHAREMQDDSEHARRIIALTDEAREEARRLEREVTRVGR